MANYPPKKIRGRKGEQFTLQRHPEEGMSDSLWQANERLDITKGTHGTVMFDQPSRHVLPANAHGNVVYENLSDRSKAYFTAHRRPDQVLNAPPGEGAAAAAKSAEESGWHWAMSTASHHTYNRQGDEPVVRPRAVVHHVTPEGEVGLDHNLNSGGLSQEMTADRLRITRTEWTPPPEVVGGKRNNIEAVQGTLPHINWNQYAPAGSGEHNWKPMQRMGRPVETSLSAMGRPVETSLSAETWRRLGQKPPPGTPKPVEEDERPKVDPRQGKLDLG